VNRLKRGLSLFALNQASDVFVHHVLAEVRGDGADELIAAQDALDIAIVEDALGSREAQRSSCDPHRDTGRGRLLAVVDLPARPFESLGEHTAKFVVPITSRRTCR